MLEVREAKPGQPRPLWVTLGVLSVGHLAVLRLGSRNLGPPLWAGYRCPSSQAPIQMDAFWFQARRSLGGLAFSLSQLEDHRAAWDSYFHALRLPERLVRMRGLVWNWGGGRQRQGAHAERVCGTGNMKRSFQPLLLRDMKGQGRPVMALGQLLPDSDNMTRP